MTDEQNAWNNDPQKQPRDMASVQATNPTAAPHGNKGAVAHQALSPADDKKESGKDIGLVNAPLQSINPTSGNQTDDKPEKAEYKIIKDIKVDGQDEFKYPLHELEAGDGMFIKVEKNSTTDKLMAEMRKMIHAYREKGAVIETDENGDEVRESVVIETKKRTDDGVIQLDGAGKPIVGANQTNRYMKVYSNNFTVRPVIKGDKLNGDGNEADSDGVLVMRAL